MTSDWRDLMVGSSDSGETLPIRDELDRLRQVMSTSPQIVFQDWLEIAMGLIDIGIPHGAREMVSELETFGLEQSIEPTAWPWIFNVAGLAHAALEDAAAAELSFTRMADLGEALPDAEQAADIVSTALQNLGNTLTRTEPSRALEILHRSLAMKQAQREPSAAIAVLMSVGIVELELGFFGDAAKHFEEVREAADRVGALEISAKAWANIGNLAVRRGEPAAAEEAFQRSLERFLDLEDFPHAVMSLESLGHLRTERGDFIEAAHAYDTALSVATDMGSAPLRFRILRSIGRLHVRQHDWSAAERAFRAALESAEELEQPVWRGDVLCDLGAILIEAERKGEADRTLRAADRLLQDQDDPQRLADVRRNRAELAFREADYDSADRLLSSSEASLRSTDRPDQVAEVLGRRAEVALSAGRAADAGQLFEAQLGSLESVAARDVVAWRAAEAGALLLGAATPELALPFFDRALAAYLELDNVRLASSVRNDRALALAALRRHGEAEAELQENLAIAARTEDRTLRREALTNLGEIRARMGDLDTAEGMLVEAVALAEALEDNEGRLDSLANLLPVLMRLGRTADARRLLLELRREDGSPGSSSNAAIAIGGTATLAMLDDDYARAVELFESAIELDRSGEPRHEIESLAGLLESLVAAASEPDRIQSAAQTLITRAQETGNEDTAWFGLVAAGGRAASRPDKALAVGLWGAAITLALVSSTDESGVVARNLEDSKFGRHADNSDFASRVGFALMQVLYGIEAWVESWDDTARENLHASLKEEVLPPLEDADDFVRQLLTDAWHAIRDADR